MPLAIVRTWLLLGLLEWRALAWLLMRRRPPMRPLVILLAAVLLGWAMASIAPTNNENVSHFLSTHL
jgi:hypothetical protein